MRALKVMTEEMVSREEYLLRRINALEQDLHRSRMELERLRAKDDAVFASIGEGVYVVDMQRRVVMINPKACELLGVKAQEVLGKSLYDAIPFFDERGDLVSRDLRPSEEVFRHHQPLTFSTSAFGAPGYFFMNQKEKKFFPVTFTVAPISMDNYTAGAVTVFRNSTQEYELSKTKTEFISLASHQLRTPLSIITLNLELLARHYRDQIEKEGISDQIREIQHAVKRMVKLVSALLNVSRIEMGTFEVFSTPSNVIRVIHDKVKELEPLFSEKHLTIHTSYGDTIPLVAADTQLLQIVVDNLLSNAVKYSHADQRVEIAVESKEDYVELRVTNRGYGIPTEARHHIFSKLFRASNIRSIGEDGTGLGLYIAKSIIDRLGGRIWFSSEENEVTTFFVALPKVQES